MSFKSNSMSLALGLLEEKLFTRTRTPTSHSDAIMSADIKTHKPDTEQGGECYNFNLINSFYDVVLTITMSLVI